jgi:glutamyl-tRNA synthetase
MMKERVLFYPEFWENGYYFFEEAKSYDEKTLRKKWKAEFRTAFDELQERLKNVADYQESQIKKTVEAFMADHGMKYGDVLPILRIALSGTTKGPSIFEMMELLGTEEVNRRLEKAYADFDALSNQ